MRGAWGPRSPTGVCSAVGPLLSRGTVPLSQGTVPHLSGNAHDDTGATNCSATSRTKARRRFSASFLQPLVASRRTAGDPPALLRGGAFPQGPGVRASSPVGHPNRRGPSSLWCLREEHTRAAETSFRQVRGPQDQLRGTKVHFSRQTHKVARPGVGRGFPGALPAPGKPQSRRTLRTVPHLLLGRWPWGSHREGRSGVSAISTVRPS